MQCVSRDGMHLTVVAVRRLGKDMGEGKSQKSGRTRRAIIAPPPLLLLQLALTLARGARKPYDNSVPFHSK